MVGALLFFASLLAHRSVTPSLPGVKGLSVTGISLWLFGGLTKFESNPETAGAELRVAAVGPLTTLGCSGLFFVLSRLLDGSGSVGLAGTMFGWLAFINLLLAALNTIPAVPLDGGHVLSALIWMKGGNRQRASLAAARVGQVLGVGLLGLGFVQLRQNGDYSIVLLFIGFFIISGAASEIRSAPVRAAIEGVITRDVMAANPPTSYEWMTVDAFLRTLPAGTTHRAYPVQAPDGRITGLLTADSILAVPRDQWASLRVSRARVPDRSCRGRPGGRAGPRRAGNGTWPARRSISSSSGPTAGWSAWSIPTPCRTPSALGSKPTRDGNRRSHIECAA